MKEIIKRKWIKALISGKYIQTRGELANGTLTKHCCLGVLCDLYIKENKLQKEIEVYDLENKGGNSEVPGGKVLRWAGLHHDTCNTLAGLNDGGSTFKEIAKYIQEKL
jgi:hypothetical protein